MTIIPADEREKINEAVEFMITRHSTSVAAVKKRFGLTSEEYDMISDLMMPALRQYNEVVHMKSQIGDLMRKLKEEQNEHSKSTAKRPKTVL